MKVLYLVSAAAWGRCGAFVPQHSSAACGVNRRVETAAVIESPFTPGTGGTRKRDDDDDDDDKEEEELPLTWDNVEMILDELRPYLMSDGGNVKIASIDGPVIRLELEGACGTCPSSTMTMKMGLERRLKEAIPEISEVLQSLPSAPQITEEAVNEVLDGVRPFLSVAGGDVQFLSLTSPTGVQPALSLRLSGKSASLNSVKTEITQRIHRYFMLANLRVVWEE